MLSHESDDVVWWWLLLFRVAICFSLRVCVSFYFDTLCWICFSGCGRVCVSRFTFGICCNLFLVARISQLNCYAFLVSLGICWHFVLNLFLLFHFGICGDICYLFLVARTSGSHITMEWLRGQLNCYAFLVSLCGICCFRVSRFVFRVMFHFGICGNFFSLRVCVSRFILAFWRWSEAVHGFFQDGVQDVVQGW